MNVVKHIICELTGYRPGAVDVSQGDRGSRAVSCRLLENGAPWMIPEGAAVRVAYTLPDGTEGLYDALPDGSPAGEIAGNIVTVKLSDQLMDLAGMSQMSIVLIGPEGGQLATWPIRVMVTDNKAARLTVPENMPPYGAGFAGKIFFGGEDGTITPLETGVGVEIVRQEDGSYALVACGIQEETDPTVPEWAKQPHKPSYTAQEVGADPTGAAAETVAAHNANQAAHPHIQEAFAELSSRINAILDSDDTTLDQLSEIVAYIKSNKTLIDAITTSKVSVADIVDNLVTDAPNKPLSAAQGVRLRQMAEAIQGLLAFDGSADGQLLMVSVGKAVPVQLGEGLKIADGRVVSSAVLYTDQNTTPEQQAVARGNIGAAEGIVLEASGEVITLTDASDQRIRGLKIYGKTIQNGTPTPEAPVELVSVGGDGSIGVTMIAKNLFDYTEHAANGNHSIIPVVGGKTLYRNGKVGTAANWRINDNADQLLGTFASFGFNASNPLVLPANASYIESTDSSGNLSELYIGYDSDTTFASYKGQGLAVQTPNGLLGIPVTSGGDYTDANGQRWVCDELDFSRGVYVQRVQKRTLTGADNWFRSTNTNYFAINIAGKLPASPIMCSRFTHVSSLTSTTPGWWSDNSANNILAITGYGDMSMDEFKAHLNENPIDIIFRLTTPIETPLSAEEIAAFRALHTNKLTTTIYNDAGAYMAVEYVADTKTYIDNKFAKLAAALVNNT